MNSNPSPTFWSRAAEAVTWSLKSALRLVLLALLLALLSAGIWVGLQEVDRSLNNIVRRIDVTEQNMGLLRNDANLLMETNQAQQQAVGRLQSEANGFDQRLTGLENQLLADLNQQEERLDLLEALMGEWAAGNERQREELAGVGTAVVSLQADVNESSGRIDHLGGEFDNLQADMTTLSSDVTEFRAEFATPDSEVARLKEAVSLFRAWELVARARLRLIENNPGLATTDTTLALTAVNGLMESSPAASSDSLSGVQERLNLALTNLPDNPTAAVRDLESAWEELDRLLAALLDPPGIGD